MRHKTSWLYKAFPEDAQRAVSELSIMGAALLLIAFMVSHTIGLTGKLPQCYFLKKNRAFLPGLWRNEGGGSAYAWLGYKKP